MGVSVKDACQWGSADNPWGNFAPMNLGVGYSGGRAWLSIFQNSPTTDAKLEFSVEIKGGDDMSGTCKYSNGQYCSDTGCSADIGCTVSSHPHDPSIAKEFPLTIHPGLRRLRHRHFRLLRLDMNQPISYQDEASRPCSPATCTKSALSSIRHPACICSHLTSLAGLAGTLRPCT